MKFKGHETFFIRKGWLSKGMKNINTNPILFVDKNNNPMDELGLGSNMVKSLRYWLLATGLTIEEISKEDKKRHQKLTDGFGQIIFNNDRFLEETGTLHLIQYKLASNKKDATSWYFFFNKFNMNEFTKEDFIIEMNKYLADEKETVPATSSIADDFTCIINTYLSRAKTQQKEIDSENNIDCPIGELGLVDVVNRKKGIYKKTIPLAATFNPWIVMAVISDNAKNQQEINLNELLIGENNIGKIFNLDSVAMLEVLHTVEKSGMIKIIRTAGLDVIQIKKMYSFSECIENYFKEIAS